MRLFVDGDFGYVDVSELTPDERVQLLNECAEEGWRVVVRGTHPVQQLLPAADGIDWVECWYFERERVK